MYKYVQVAEEQFVSYRHEVIYYPHKPKWPNQWEWKLDFSDIRLLLKRTILYYVYTFLILFLRKKGFINFPYETKLKLKEISVNDLTDYLLEAIRNQNSEHYLSLYKCMIVFGPDVKNKLYEVTSIFQTSIEFRFGYKSELYFYDIPVIYCPTISGIHVLPDLTGKWNEKVVGEPQPTTFYRSRYRH